MTDYLQAKLALEKAWLSELMERYHYNQSKAATAMGISRGSLRSKLRKHFGTKYFREGLPE